MPLTAMRCRGSVMPLTKTWSRSTLESTNRTVPPAAGFFAQDVPGFDGLAEFDLDAAVFDGAVEGETELEMRSEPFAFRVDSRLCQIVKHVIEILLDEMRQHEAVVDFGAPADEAVLIGLLPELGDQGAEEEVLGQAHPGVRRHLESAHFEQPEAARGGFGGI